MKTEDPVRPVTRGAHASTPPRALAGRLWRALARRRVPERNHEPALQAEHMVEPDRPGVAHGGAQQLTYGHEVVFVHGVRVERRQAPVLAARIELVGRRCAQRIAGQEWIDQYLARSIVQCECRMSKVTNLERFTPPCLPPSGRDG